MNATDLSATSKAWLESEKERETRHVELCEQNGIPEDQRDEGALSRTAGSAEHRRRSRSSTPPTRRTAICGADVQRGLRRNRRDRAGLAGHAAGRRAGDGGPRSTDRARIRRTAQSGGWNGIPGQAPGRSGGGVRTARPRNGRAGHGAELWGSYRRHAGQGRRTTRRKGGGHSSGTVGSDAEQNENHGINKISHRNEETGTAGAARPVHRIQNRAATARKPARGHPADGGSTPDQEKGPGGATD